MVEPLSGLTKQLTVIQPCGEGNSECGYCHSTEEKRVSYGFIAKSCTCVDYQALCDAGWRRSGTYIYLPTNATTCCPNLTIRLDVTRFQASKHQLRVIKNLRRFLAGDFDESRGSSAPTISPAATPVPSAEAERQRVPDAVCAALSDVMLSALLRVFPTLPVAAVTGAAVSPVPTRLAGEVARAPETEADVSACYPPTHASNLAFVAAAAWRKLNGERRPAKKQQQQGSNASTAGTSGEETADAGSPSTKPADVAAALAAAAQLEYDAIAAAAEATRADTSATSAGSSGDRVVFSAAPTGHVNIRVGGSGVWARPRAYTEQSSWSTGSLAPVFVPVEATVAADASAGAGEHKRARKLQPAERGGVRDFSASERPPAHTWLVDMVPAAFDEEAFALYKRYQVAVHGDKPEEVTRKGYTNFLCASPLIREPLGAPVGSDLLHDGTAVAAAAAPPALGGGPGGKRDVQPHEALLRCARAVSAAWSAGEGAGAGVPLTCSPRPVVYHGFRGGGEHVFPDLPQETDGGAPTACAVSSPSFGVVEPVTASASAASAAPASPMAGTAAAATAASAAALAAQGYGSFHQRYFLDGRLIAVGVVDVLPCCLSSVYVFYEPALGKQLQLGKLTALREIQWVQAVYAAVSPRLRYYYMGYYVHSCPKMRYKADYAPSDLRCPVTGEWVPLAACTAALDADPHATLVRLPPAEAERRRQRDAAALAALVPAVPFLLEGSDPGRPLVLRQLQPRGQAVLTGIFRDLLLRLGVADDAGGAAGALAARVVAYVR